MRNSKYSKIRTEIKKLSDEQKLYKPQRKESYASKSGDRAGLTPYGAQTLVLQNKESLRYLFEAYALLKGKVRTDCWKNPTIPSRVEKLAERYRPLVEVSE